MIDQEPKIKANSVGNTEEERKQTYLRRRQAAQYLHDRGVPGTEKSLAKLASTTGGGPIYQKWGRVPLYTVEDLDRYIAEKLGKPVRSTSEYGAE